MGESTADWEGGQVPGGRASDASDGLQGTEPKATRLRIDLIVLTGPPPPAQVFLPNAQR